VFEDNYTAYNQGNRSDELSQLPSENIDNYQRQNYAYLVYSVPSNWTSDQMKQFITQIQVGGQYIYLTDLSSSDEDNVYGEFGSNWSEFVSVMGNLHS